MTLSDGMALVADATDEVVASAEPVTLSATPLDQSLGMAEVSQERPYRAKPTSTPITNTIASASLLGVGAIDQLRAVATLLRGPELPLWSPLTNARAGVDAAAQMFWLIEPGIGVEARVQRGMVMRLHNARQQQLAPPEIKEAHKRGQAAVADVDAQATALGWTISGKRQKYARVGAETFPTARNAIDTVLRYRKPTRDTEAHIAWWFYSGVTHGNLFAFMQFVAPAEAQPTGVAGLSNAPLYKNGRQLTAAVATAGRAVINAVLAHAALLGADRTNIEKAERQFSETIVGAFQAMDRSEDQ